MWGFKRSPLGVSIGEGGTARREILSLVTIRVASSVLFFKNKPALVNVVLLLFAVDSCKQQQAEPKEVCWSQRRREMSN